MKTFRLEIMTPDGTAFADEAEKLTIRTTEGDLCILAGHADCLAAVGTGVCKVGDANGNERVAAVSGGFLTVEKGEARVVATTFEFADEIDIKRAQKAKERAEEKLRAKSDEREGEMARAKLARALSRISVAEMTRGK